MKYSGLLVGVPSLMGTLARLSEQCVKNLKEVEAQMKHALVKAEILHQDETGLYIKG